MTDVQRKRKEAAGTPGFQSLPSLLKPSGGWLSHSLNPEIQWKFFHSQTLPTVLQWSLTALVGEMGEAKQRMVGRR